MINDTVTVLLVEDDDIDAETVVRSFNKLKIGNPVRHARDGEEALEILRGENGFAPIDGPYVVLLDLNMPRLNGHDFLTEIRNDPMLDQTVVFVLTTSSAEEDCHKAYKKNVAGYIVKQEAGKGFIEAVKMLEQFWHVVTFPNSRMAS